jgi:hypothetical protein
VFEVAQGNKMCVCLKGMEKSLEKEPFQGKEVRREEL